MTGNDVDTGVLHLQKKLKTLGGGLLVVAVICAILGLMLGGNWWFFYIIAGVAFVIALISLLLSRKYA